MYILRNVTDNIKISCCHCKIANHLNAMDSNDSGPIQSDILAILFAPKSIENFIVG